MQPGVHKGTRHGFFVPPQGGKIVQPQKNAQENVPTVVTGVAATSGFGTASRLPTRISTMPRAEKKDEPASIDELLKIATFPTPPVGADTAAVVRADLESTNHDVPIPENSRIYSYVELFQVRLRRR